MVAGAIAKSKKENLSSEYILGSFLASKLPFNSATKKEIKGINPQIVACEFNMND
jgi:hypothetical protein